MEIQISRREIMTGELLSEWRRERDGISIKCVFKTSVFLYCNLTEKNKQTIEKNICCKIRFRVSFCK